MCLFSEFKNSVLFAKVLCKNGELDELINKSYGVVSVIVAIIIRANNGVVGMRNGVRDVLFNRDSIFFIHTGIP